MELSKEEIMGKKKHRGRPFTFETPQRYRISKLIREHGIAETKRRMRLKICADTLAKIAREYGIELRTGRRPAA